MFKHTGMIVLASLFISSTVMAFEVDESKISTPDEAIAALKAGNERFVTGEMMNQDFGKQIDKTSGDQHPYAAILSCLDSRIPTEIVFDQGIGDVFVGRVAGNVEDINMIGSFEFAAALKGVKAIVIMGHTACGAVGGACQNAKLGNLTLLLDEIQPAVELVKHEHPNENVCDAPLVDDISEANVVKTINDIRAKSTVISTLESEGKVKLVGAMYDITTGKVRFL
jgi:carbonic anhydrase